MRRWLRAAADAANVVSVSPSTWAYGGLAWAATAGPIALLVAVVPLPTVSELTFAGAGTFVAETWPWNAIGLGAVAVALLLGAIAMVAIADVAILRAEASVASIARASAVTILAMLPALGVAGTLAVTMAGVVTVEFGAPDAGAGGPVARTLARVGPLLAVLVAAALVGSAYGAVARQVVIDPHAGRSVLGAMRAAAGLMRRAGASSAVQAVAAAGMRTAYLAFCAVLLVVLWAPIGQGLRFGRGFGPSEGALLVGFVAIWLCLVAGGGAVHAWGTLAWARLAGSVAGLARDRETSTIP